LCCRFYVSLLLLAVRPRSALFPYTTLFRSLLYWETLKAACADGVGRFDFGRSSRNSGTYRFKVQWGAREEPLYWYTIPISSRPRDRKSTRLNSSHGSISYAVFCLKKKRIGQ